MKSLKQRTEIQQAYLDGNQIEFKSNTDDPSYKDVGSSCAFAHWIGGDYRIKREPIEIWVIEFETGTKMIVEDGYITSQKGVIRKFIEVLD